MHKRFILNRLEDETGISGLGEVAEGIEFSNKQCALRWRTNPGSIGIYANMSNLMKIHGHDGKTALIWVDTDG